VSLDLTIALQYRQTHDFLLDKGDDGGDAWRHEGPVRPLWIFGIRRPSLRCCECDDAFQVDAVVGHQLHTAIVV